MEMNMLSELVRIQAIHKYILYLASVIYAVSLFVPLQSVDSTLIQTKSLAIIIAGVVFWFILQIIDSLPTMKDSSHLSVKDIRNYQVWYKFMQGTYIIISILIAVVF